MDKPCERSWTGARENFQARKYDVGASPTTSECGGKCQRILEHDKLVEMFCSSICQT
jgi:hypothetical protein